MLNDDKYESLNSAVAEIVSKGEDLRAKQLQDQYGLNESRDDKMTLDQFPTRPEVIKTLMKDSKIKSHAKKFSDAYSFLKLKDVINMDGNDLVFFDKTVASFNSKVSIGDVKKQILKIPAPKK